LCKIIKCKHTTIKIIKGTKKCKTKTLDKVACPTTSPPKSKVTILGPIKGTIEKKLKITVAAQYDI
jgi:hypothetical protein